jgi:hypothetical protein
MAHPMKPFRYVRPTARSLGLVILGNDVDDDRFLRIFAELAKLISTSATFCDDSRDNSFAETEVDYIEELLGLSFVLLQVKILRVSEAAEGFPLGLANARALGDHYKDTGRSLVELIWAVANYYKHRDEWDADVWEDKKKGEQESKALRRSRHTRRAVEKIGIERSSTGNMRTAYNFFEIDWASDCTPLADKVQKWATAVYQKCNNP